MTEIQLQPGDEELLGLCAPSPSSAPAGDRQSPAFDLNEISGNPFHFNMAGAVMNVSNSEVQFGAKIVASPTPETPVINIRGV
jgi:hypothetical protein